MCIRDRYIIAVDINISNRVVHINFTACKIMLNNCVKNIMSVSLFQLVTLKKTRNQFKIFAPTFSDFGEGYITHITPLGSPLAFGINRGTASRTGEVYIFVNRNTLQRTRYVYSFCGSQTRRPKRGNTKVK